MSAPAVPAGTAPAITAPRRRRFNATRQLLARPDGMAGVLILVVFTLLALAPSLLVGELQTAVTATGPRR